MGWSGVDQTSGRGPKTYDAEEGTDPDCERAMTDGLAEWQSASFWCPSRTAPTPRTIAHPAHSSAVSLTARTLFLLQMSCPSQATIYDNIFQFFAWILLSHVLICHLFLRYSRDLSYSLMMCCFQLLCVCCLSRVSTLTRDIDIAFLSVRPSVCPSVSSRHWMKTA